MATTPVFTRITLMAPLRHQRKITPQPAELTAPSLREALWVWSGLGVLTLAVLVTYARFPVSEFYHVSIDGIAGGLSRALVLLNFPIAFIALALMGFAVARLYADPGTLGSTARWLVGLTAASATAMLLVAAFVVDQGDLDAKPANAVPAAGVAMALALTLYAVRNTGGGARQPWTRSDTVRLVAIALLVLAALPWMLADMGVFVGDIPLIGNLYMSKEIQAGDTLPVVHLGHHHGLDGAIFAAVAIVMSRQLGRLRGPLRWPLTAYTALMLVYGLANALQDFWGEQLVKRGWTDAHVPTMLLPKISPAFGLLLLATVIVTIIMLAATRPEKRSAVQLGAG